LTENSSIDVNTTSDYVIIISCTDGIDTTFFNLTLRFTTKDPAVTEKPDLDLTLLSTTKDPAVTEKPDPQSDTIAIIIGASIGGLFILVVIIVFCVSKRQHKNNDEIKVYEKPLQLSNIEGSSDGTTPNNIP